MWVLFGIALLSLSRVQGAQIIGCETEKQILSHESSIPIHSEEYDVQILWQYQTLTSAPFQNLGVSNTNLLSSENVALYWQPIDIANCLRNPLVVALDMYTGNEIWRIEVDNFVTQLFAVTDGFLITNPVRIMLVDIDGEKRWEKTVHNTEIPLRSIQSVSEIEDVITISTYRSMFYVQAQTGTIIEQQPLENVVQVEDGRMLVISGDHQLQLVDINTNESIYDLNLKLSRFHDVRINSLYPRADRFEEVLLLYFETKGVEAYDYRTGEFLWELEKSIYSIPTLVDDSLAIYTPENSVEFYDPVDGMLVGTIHIPSSVSRASESFDGIDPLFLIGITGFEDVLLVRNLITAQLFSVQLHVS